MRPNRSLLYRLPAALILLVVWLAADHATTSGAARTFKNPIYKQDFPDPSVLKVGKTYYAYATNSNSVTTPMLKSTDLVHWNSIGDAMPVPPRWTVADTWAPSVSKLHDGKYILAFASREMTSQQECLGEAFASSPAGPFKSSEKHPMFCQHKIGGDIDPDVFQDKNGTEYLLWKNDGNSVGVRTYLWSQRLSPDGTKLEGKPAKLVYNSQSWEGNVTEAPVLWLHGGHYYLFFSGNAYDTWSYAVGSATCSSPLGPCKNNPHNPILKTSPKCSGALGPGGESIVTDAKGQTWMVYHAWTQQGAGSPNPRFLWIDRLDWKNGQPVVHGPTCGKQQAPAT